MRVGPAGAGQTVKAANQLLVAALKAQGHGRLDHGALLLLVDQLSGRTGEQDGERR